MRGPAGQLIKLDEPLSEDDVARLQLFEDHFLEFWENFEDMRNTGLRSEWHINLLENGQVETSGLGLSRHRLKGFLLDYRKFHQQKEPTHFFGICKIAKRRCRDSRFQDRVEANKERWKSPSLAVLGWHNDITIAEFLDAHFNQSLFHVRRPGDSADPVGLLAEQLGPEATQVALFASPTNDC